MSSHQRPFRSRAGSRSFLPGTSLAAACALALVTAAGFGCSGPGSSDSSSDSADAGPTGGQRLSVPEGTTYLDRTLGGAAGIVIDGDVSEWSLDSAIEGDAGYLYLRLSVAREPVNIQAHNETVRVELDTDANPQTGFSVGGLGVDLAIMFSPMGDEGLTNGMRALAYSPSGEETNVPHAMLDLASAPTYAAPWFELRIARRLDAEGMLPEQGLLTSGLVRGRTALYDGEGSFIGATAVYERELPPASPVPMLADRQIPSKADGAIRVMSMNVLRGKLNDNPAAFVRLFRGLNPDVLLLQEWSDASEEEMESWFNDSGYFSGEGEWDVVTSSAWGVAVASRLPLRPMGSATLRAIDQSEGNPIRYVGAVVETESGPLAVASVHLKCCGSLGSREDVRRTEEAMAINAEFGSAAEAEGASMRVIAGDMNLVGGYDPLSTLSQRLDSDGSSMLILDPGVLGDNAWYTWSDERSRFSPGRLDYALVSDASLSVASAFVLDTARLAPNVLKSARLGSGDTSESDHLPLVFDVMPAD